MILEYHKPDSMDTALELLGRNTPKTIPLGGGTVVSAVSDQDIALVDLSQLGLHEIRVRNNFLEIGATATLAHLAQTPEAQPLLGKALYYETTHNLKQTATVAGTLVVSDGRSPFAVALMALDAKIVIQPGDEEVEIGQLLNARDEILPGRLITSVVLPLRVEMAYEYVARTPADQPIVATAAVRWPSGRVRIVVGGFGAVPRLALDAPEPGGIEFAVRNVCGNAADEWASAEYRQATAVILVKRCLDAIQAIQN